MSDYASGMMSVNEFCRWAGIGRTKAYEEIGTGRLATALVGCRRLVPREEAARWLKGHMQLLASVRP